MEYLSSVAGTGGEGVCVCVGGSYSKQLKNATGWDTHTHTGSREERSA